MKFLEQAKPSGRLQLKVFQVGGGVRTLIAEYDDDNLIMTSGLELIALLLTGSAGNNKISKIGAGTGVIPPNKADTGLTGTYSKALDGYTFTSENTVCFRFSLDSGDANGMLITEWGLFSGDDVIFSRKLQSTPIPKASDIIIEGLWSVTSFQCKEYHFTSVPEVNYSIDSDIT